MATPTIYKLHALVDLRYALKEWPTFKTGYLLSANTSIRITREGLDLIHLITLDGKPALPVSYTLAQIPTQPANRSERVHDHPATL